MVNTHTHTHTHTHLLPYSLLPLPSCRCQVASVVSDSMRPHRRQPTRLPGPWDSPGKNTGVGCHFLLQCKSLSRVQLLAIPWTAAYQAPLSMGFSRQEYWNGVPLPSLAPFLLSAKYFPGGSDDKKSACNVGDLGLIPELGRSPGEGNSYPLQYSGLENSMDRGAGRIQSIGLQRVRATFTQIQSGSLIHHEEGLDLIFMTL